MALKIVDHSEAASKVIALREGTLSTSAQHPNVVSLLGHPLASLNKHCKHPRKNCASNLLYSRTDMDSKSHGMSPVAAL